MINKTKNKTYTIVPIYYMHSRPIQMFLIFFNRQLRSGTEKGKIFVFFAFVKCCVLSHADKPSHLSITPPESPLRPLLGARASSSSKKTTHGLALRAFLNTADRVKTGVSGASIMLPIRSHTHEAPIIILTVR